MFYNFLLFPNAERADELDVLMKSRGHIRSSSSMSPPAQSILVARVFYSDVLYQPVPFVQSSTQYATTRNGRTTSYTYSDDGATYYPGITSPYYTY